jgi:predicted dehydrogenase
LGPVAEVTAYASIGNPTRTVGAAGGRVIDVEVPTTVNGVLRFDSGANVSLAASWDVWAHQRQPIELYGTEGSLLVPDPNFFGGAPLLSRRGAAWEPIDITDRPFGAANRTLGSGREVADYRIVGLLDMALAIRQDRPHRAAGELALHVLEVLDAFEHSSLQRRHIEIRTRCARPVALGPGKGEEVFWNA